MGKPYRLCQRKCFFCRTFDRSGHQNSRPRLVDDCLGDLDAHPRLANDRMCDGTDRINDGTRVIYVVSYKIDNALDVSVQSFRKNLIENRQ